MEIVDKSRHLVVTATTPVLEARRTVDWIPEGLLRTCCCDTTLCCWTWTPPDWVDKARAKVDCCCCCPFQVICCWCPPLGTWLEAWDITSTLCWSPTDPPSLLFFFGTRRTWYNYLEQPRGTVFCDVIQILGWIRIAISRKRKSGPRRPLDFLSLK